MNSKPDMETIAQLVATISHDWEMMSHEDAVGFHDDRILLILGPLSTAYPILLTDIPKTAALLIETSELPLRERQIRLPNLDDDMVTAYLELGCTKLFTPEYVWGDLIQLAITSQVLQDKMVQMHDIAVLKKKARMTVNGKAEMFTDKEYEIAWKTCRAAEGGEWVLQILNDVRSKLEDETPGLEAQAVRDQSSAPALCTPTGKGPSSNQNLAMASAVDTYGAVNKGNQNSQNSSDNSTEDTEKNGQIPKYAKSALRGKRITLSKEEEGKQYPIRQPRIPPSVEALQTGKAKNFVWPDRKMKKDD
jgi:hypothetical protein